MTAKILQLVNSAFFGLCAHVASPAQAASLLGLETVKALVLSAQIFEQFNRGPLSSSALGDLWGHSMRTGVVAKNIAEKEKQQKTAVDHAFMAGLNSCGA